MIIRPAARVLRVSFPRLSPIAAQTRHFSSSKQNKAKNRIYTPVRRPDDFQTYLLLSTSSRVPLLTFWTASYCSTCRSVSPLLNSLISSGVGGEEGGVSFCEIEYDSPDIMSSDLGMTCMITSMPTLLSFDRGEAMGETRVTDPKLMKDERWLREWIRNEARRRGGGAGGGGLGPGLFGGLFGLGNR